MLPIISVPLSTSTVPVNLESALIICFLPSSPAIFTLIIVFMESVRFSVNSPLNSQSVLLVKINFTVLASSVLDSFDILPSPCNPPIFIKVFVAGTAGSVGRQLIVVVLFRRFSMGVLPSLFVIYIMPSISTSGILSECIAIGSSL